MSSRVRLIQPKSLTNIKLAGLFMVAAPLAAYLSIGPDYAQKLDAVEKDKACDRGFLDVATNQHLPMTGADVTYNAAEKKCRATYPDGKTHDWTLGQ